MTNLLDRVNRFIFEHSLLRRNERILVAVSGGVDSMVLLHLLRQLAATQGWKLCVAHYNHQLRGRSSAADERFVGRSAAVLGLPLAVEQGQVKSFALAQKQSIEMAARQLRHEFLARIARRLKCKTIALGHHADDQVELFFLRLLRGAGGEGIAGMKPRGPSPMDTRIRLVRPLLDVGREAIERYARENGIRFRVDASNAALDFRRNRIRHELLPLLEKHYQPAVRKTVPRFMQIIGAEADCVTAVARKWLAQKGSATSFNRLPTAVQRRCLHLQLLRLKVDSDFELIEALRKRPGLPVSLGPQTAAIRNQAGAVELLGRSPAIFKSDELPVALQARAGKVTLAGVEASWRVVAHRHQNLVRAPGRESFDADAVGDQIVLRHWRPGDRYQPIGIKTSIKLQDAFTNQKIPATRRRELVVATTGAGEIFWIEGLRIAERFKLTARTRRRLDWRWRAGHLCTRPASRDDAPWSGKASGADVRRLRHANRQQHGTSSPASTGQQACRDAHSWG